ncbi:MAG: replicative DNA helicase [Xenococcaceae cyanobacterium MO_188.B19]|nr:replicative DNA helicase [Xenococcaceae cyanobacterium MO_188.B19]
MINDKLPPVNIEAEEAILGGILLDPEAMVRVADTLVKEAFSLQSHQQIYHAAQTLHSQGKPTDLMSVSSYLADHSLLEDIGGTTKLAQLVNRTVSAVNIDRYANLVMNKYARRQLITSGHEIVELGYDTTKDLEVVLDESEQKIFRLSQERPQQGLVAISDTLINAFNTIEELHQETALPGIPSGFYDLDAITSGFSRSDLIILAGRPSMGKTAMALNIAQNIAKKQRLPIAIFSLEMSREQLAQRMLASESKIASNRLRSGRISQNEIESLVDGVGSLSELPVYIDDTANLSVMQMRSQVRRLQGQLKSELGLVLLDYLQLMEGSGSDNRVQELSKITRSLKGLAREVNAPIIALSQLSRGVEQRNNKRPMLSDLRESGCLSGNTLVTLENGLEVPIRDLAGSSGFTVWSLNNDTNKIEPTLVTNAFCTGIKPVFRLTTALGRTINATANHKFLTINSWSRLDNLEIGETIAIPKCIKFGTCYIVNTSKDISRNTAVKLATAVKSDTITQLANSDIYEDTTVEPSSAARDVHWDKIVSIEYIGETDVYDLTVPKHHNFIANNIIVHNSIEQDADLVIMLYRDEYYNPDTPDRGIAEAIIVKHRNGPVGTVKLIFQGEFTKFENLARPSNY